MRGIDYSELVKKCIKIVGCETGRISNPCDTLFFITGTSRSTKDINDSWWSDETGKRIDFDYVEEHVIASGRTPRKLLASVREYVKTSKMTAAESVTYLMKRWQKAKGKK